jgi:hypothetical protein
MVKPNERAGNPLLQFISAFPGKSAEEAFQQIEASTCRLHSSPTVGPSETGFVSSGTKGWKKSNCLELPKKFGI